jgi:hypothetical protein
LVDEEKLFLCGFYGVKKDAVGYFFDQERPADGSPLFIEKAQFLHFFVDRLPEVYRIDIRSHGTDSFW